jgi:hypothetical protein
VNKQIMPPPSVLFPPSPPPDDDFDDEDAHGTPRCYYCGLQLKRIQKTSRHMGNGYYKMVFICDTCRKSHNHEKENADKRTRIGCCVVAGAWLLLAIMTRDPGLACGLVFVGFICYICLRSILEAFI